MSDTIAIRIEEGTRRQSTRVTNHESPLTSQPRPGPESNDLHQVRRAIAQVLDRNALHRGEYRRGRHQAVAAVSPFAFRHIQGLVRELNYVFDGQVPTLILQPGKGRPADRARLVHFDSITDIKRQVANRFQTARTQ